MKASKNFPKGQNAKSAKFGETPDAKHFQSEDAAVMPRLFGGMDDRQIAKPSLRIVQPMSTMPDAVKNIGRIYNTMSGVFLDEMELAIFAAPSANDTPRVLKEKKFDRAGNEVYFPDAEILCSSSNGVYPYQHHVGREIDDELGAEFQGEIIPEDCAGCIFNSSNICSVYYRYYAMQIKSNGAWTPVALRFKGMLLGAAKKLNHLLVENESAGIYTTIIMRTEGQETSYGSTVYVPVFEAGRQLTMSDPLMQTVARVNADYQRQQRAMLESGNVAQLKAQVKADSE